MNSLQVLRKEIGKMPKGKKKKKPTKHQIDKQTILISALIDLIVSFLTALFSFWLNNK